MWKDLSPDVRLRAADAFWRDKSSDDVAAQQIEAIVMLAQRLKFRPKSLQALPVERRAKQLAQVSDVSDAIATRALIAYHFADQRPLMGAFLDALGIAHEDGLIQADDVQPPDAEKLSEAARELRTRFPPHDVDLYLRTLAVLDGDTWGGVNAALDAPTT